MTSKRVALCTTSIVALAVIASPAVAQTADQRQDPQDQQQPPATSAPSAGDSDATVAGTGQDIIVTGVRAAYAKALQVKRNSTQVVESVVAEDIGKLPDNNVVEALQRITGVQVTDRSGDEVNTLSIRGLPDVTTTLNGRNVFTASGQSFALADIPATLVQRIDVYKTRAADQIPAGIGGEIDVLTHRPFDFDGFTVAADARGIYSQYAKKVNPNVSALISDRWHTGIGDFGILVDGSYAHTRYRDESVTAGALVPYATADNPPAGWGPLERIQPTDPRAPGQQIWEPGLQTGLPDAEGSTFAINGVQVPYILSRDAVFQSELDGNRTRPAVNVAMQYAPDSDSTYTFEFLWDGYRNTTYNDLLFNFIDYAGGLGADPASTITTYPGTNIAHTRFIGFPFNFTSGDLTKSRTDSFVYALNGDWHFGNLHLNADASYQTSTFSSQFIAMRASRVPASIDVNLNTGNGIPSFHYDDDSLATDPSQWTIGEFYDNANRNKGNAYTFQGKGNYDFDAGIFKKLSFGLRYDDRRALEAQRTQDAPALNMPMSGFDSGLQYVNHDFFDGRADVPTTWVAPNGHYVYAHADEFRQLYQSTVDPGIQTSDALHLTQNFDVHEITMETYVMGDFEVDVLGRPLRLEAGARYTDFDTDLNFTDLLSGAQTHASREAGKVLPSATLIYDITSKLRARFNYGETLRRPNFADLNPNYQLTGDLTNVGYGSGSGGNPTLAPTYSKNYDLSLEWYFQRDSAIYGTLFERDVQGLVVPLRSYVSIPNSNLNTTNFIITRPANASDGVLKGAELGFVYFPNFLPGLLNGLGAQGSLTYLHSTQNIPITDELGNIVDQQRTSFFGVSNFSYNITGAYQHGPIGARLSWVWRKNFLANNEAALFANPIGVWRRPEKSLDFQLNFDVTKSVAVTFDATNLTKALSQTYYRFGDAGGPETDNLGSAIIDRTFALGVRFALR
ncbi:TonB-dependent receptor [Sphingomonas koreensis]|nr:TonB-dependent receptor [Sphingomonas koreensis]